MWCGRGRVCLIQHGILVGNLLERNVMWSSVEFALFVLLSPRASFLHFLNTFPHQRVGFTSIEESCSSRYSFLEISLGSSFGDFFIRFYRASRGH